MPDQQHHNIGSGSAPFLEYVVFGEDGVARPHYKLDLLDRVVYSPNPFAARAENGWPAHSRLADFETAGQDAALVGQQPRHAFLKYVMHMFRPPTGVVPEEGQDNSLLSCYPDGQLQKVDNIFYPIVRRPNTDGEILEVIRAIMEAEPGNEMAANAVALLSDMGVVQIPDLPVFLRQYHEDPSGASKDGDPIHRLDRRGWVRNGRVLIRSVATAKSG